MPKMVDHTARRAEISDAVRRVVRREGTSAATVRRVAQEVGWSPGSVRYYFPDQAALLRLVIALTFEAVPPRIESHLRTWYADAGARRDPVGSAQRLLEELLPLDEQRAHETHVWLATMDAARHDGELAETRRLTWAGMRQVARIATAWVRGREVDPHLGRLLEEPLAPPSDELAASTLHATIDGLAVQSFCYPELAGPEEVRITLRAALEDVARGA